MSWAVARLRHRYTYGSILYAGFIGTGVLLIVHVITTYWRDPGLDAVFTAALTLIPIGLAVSLNAALLQALVQLESPPESEGPVIVVYATVTTIVAPLGGLLLGAAADLVSLYWALAGCGLAMIIVAVCLHSRFSVFDEIGAAPTRPHPPSVGHHWALAHFLGPEHVQHAIAHMHLAHLHRGDRPPAADSARGGGGLGRSGRDQRAGVVVHDLAHVVAGETVDLLHEAGRFGQPLGVRVVGAEQHPVGADLVDEREHVVLEER